MSELLHAVYQRLLAFYGPQHWWPAETPFEVVVGAILTQSAAWRNVEQAIANLKAEDALTPSRLAALSESELASLIRPSGYFNVKARKIKAFVSHLLAAHGGRLEAMFSQDAATLRLELLSLYGIGPETADSIILYAAGKPSFVVDAYTRRILSRIGAVHDPRASYAEIQALFTDRLPRETRLFQEYHAQLVRHAKDTCRVVPRCDGCPLLEICTLGQQRAGAGGTISAIV